MFFSQFIENQRVFELLTYVLGITWSCILAGIFSVILVKPLQQLEKSATLVAEGKIGQDVNVPKSRDEIASVAEAFQLMVTNLRQMVESIEGNFNKTNEVIIELSEQTSAASLKAEGIAQTVSQISQGAEGSAVAVQETAEAIEDVRQLASEVNTRALNSANQSKEIIHSLETTTDSIQGLVTSIQQIAQGMKKPLETYTSLRKR